MSVHQDQIRTRIAALEDVEVKGVRIGTITPTAAALAAGEGQAFFRLLLDDDRDTRVGTLRRAAEHLGVTPGSLVDSKIKVANMKKFPPPKWIYEMARDRLSHEARREARIKRALDEGKPVGICSDRGCGKEDALIGKTRLCGACYQRERRKRLASAAESVE